MAKVDEKYKPRWSYAAYRPHHRVKARNNEPSATRQEFQRECDLNDLMARYQKQGVISHVNPARPAYMDLTNMPDLHESMRIMHDAENAFMSLPAKVRREFDNDPLKFVAFAEDAENIGQMRSWGLAEPLPVPPAPVKVEVVGEPPAAVKPAGTVSP